MSPLPLAFRSAYFDPELLEQVLRAGVLDLLVDLVGDGDVALLARGAHPARGVDGVADEGELRLVQPDDAGDDLAAVQADLDLQVVLVAVDDGARRLDHLEGHLQHPPLLALEDLRGLVDGQRLQLRAGQVRLADGLDLLGAVDHADFVEEAEQVVDERHDVLLLDLDDLVEVDDLAEEDRHLLVLLLVDVLAALYNSQDCSSSAGTRRRAPGCRGCPASG